LPVKRHRNDSINFRKFEVQQHIGERMFKSFDAVIFKKVYGFSQGAIVQTEHTD
jgi:hypothetical protein